MKSLFSMTLSTCMAAVAFVLLMSAPMIESVMACLLVVLVFFSKRDENSQLFTLCFAIVFIISSVIMYLLESVAYPSISDGFLQNTVAFGTQLLLSLILLFLLKHRMTIAVLITKGKSASVFEKNYAEGPLYLLVLTLVAVDLFALIENFIRNLEHLGVAEETASTFWEFTFFYDYFEYLKAVPMLLCVMMLYVGLMVRTKSHQLQS